MPHPKKYQALQTLRIEDPVLWAILLGKRMPLTISRFLIMDQTEVEIRVAQLLLERRLTWTNFMGRDLLRPLGDLSTLAKYAKKFQEGIL